MKVSPRQKKCQALRVRRDTEGERHLSMETLSVPSNSPQSECGQKTTQNQRLAVYLATILSATIVLAIWLLRFFSTITLPTIACIGLFCVLSLAASFSVVSILNQGLLRRFRPNPLPGLELRNGLPASCKTLVVVPTLMGDSAEIDRLVSDLEDRFLANRDEQIHFCLLSDFRDAQTEHISADEEILRHVRGRIRQLNARYGDYFLLLHRPRRWNPYDRIWMGYERKRGKLVDLNRLICTGCKKAFSAWEGSIEWLASVRYVITLDADNRLSPGAVKTLVRMMAHPANEVRYDKHGKIISGYGVVQPRPVQLPSKESPTRYQDIWCDGWEPATENYLVGEIFQDLFGESAFVGKGIYDPRIFEKAMRNSIPPNQVLSHDILEGGYARCALASDVIVTEECPRSYLADMARFHRWTRGDWQLGPWILPWVLDEHGNWRRNTLRPLVRWKLVDNIRRTLLPAACVGMLILGWILASSPELWTGVGVGLFFAPTIVESLLAGKNRKRVSFEKHNVSVEMKLAVRASVDFVFLLHTAIVAVDAICRATWRMLVSRRRLLEWSVAATSHPRAQMTLLECVCRMSGSMGIVVCIFAELIMNHLAALPCAAPVLCLWLFGPGLAWWTGGPLRGTSLQR